MDRVEQARRRAARAQPREFAFQHRNRPLHPTADICEIHFVPWLPVYRGRFVSRSVRGRAPRRSGQAQPSATTVARPFPLRISTKAPGCLMEKTITGIRLSRARAIAAVSITWRPCGQHVVVAQPVVAHRLAVLLGIGRIDPVDLGALEHRVAAHLGAAQAAAVSVVRNGLPMPPAKITTSPASKAVSARALVEGLADRRHGHRREQPRRRPSTRPASAGARCAFITVASMPIWSPATRLPPALAMAMPRKMLPPPTTTPMRMPSLTASAISPASGRSPCRRCRMAGRREALRRRP